MAKEAELRKTITSLQATTDEALAGAAKDRAAATHAKSRLNVAMEVRESLGLNPMRIDDSFMS